MSELDFEIEFLDEDAEIVQHLVTGSEQADDVNVPVTLTKSVTNKQSPLLVERTRGERNRRKRKNLEEDSDYDPNEDVPVPSPPSPIRKTVDRKKKMPPIKKAKTIGQVIKLVPKTRLEEEPVDRKKCNIRVPDYDDPLCLPVKACNEDASDVQKLNKWNNVCLEHFRHCNSMLKPENGETKSSIRTVVLRNIDNGPTGKLETSIWSKTSVENQDGDRKSEIFQCVLPQFKQKKSLSSYQMLQKKTKFKSFKNVDEVLLTREKQKDEETLVVYKPKESISAIYKLFDRNVSATNPNEMSKQNDDEKSMFIKEVAFCKVCAPCYQSSWRGNNVAKKKKLVPCAVCGRGLRSAAALLGHARDHAPSDVRRCKKLISLALSNILEYHYKCRICWNRFPNIKALRQHVKTHKGENSFTCEIGNHAVE